MKKFFLVGVVLLLVLGMVALVFADIKETQIFQCDENSRGGAGRLTVQQIIHKCSLRLRIALTNH